MSDGEDTGGRGVCRDFQRGLCKRKFCKYEHPNEYAKPADDVQFCHDFQNGRCSRSNCRYVHCNKEEEEEYRLSGDASILQNARNASIPNKSDVPICKDWMKGKCFREERCKFFHPSEPSQPLRNPGYNDSMNFRPPAKRMYGEMGGYGMGGMGNAAMLQDENMMLQEKVATLQARLMQMESTNEMLLEQNARLRSQVKISGGNSSANSMASDMKSMAAAGGMTWNGGYY